MSAERPAVVLAGGKARRMGGGDKCLIPLAGRPLIEHILQRLTPQAFPIALNANGDPARFAAVPLPVIADRDDEGRGPLAGILAGMRWAAELHFECVVSVAGDTPFLPTDLVARLRAAWRPETPIVFAATTGPDGRILRHPTFGLWPTGLADRLEAALADGTRKVVAFADAQGSAVASFPADPDPFFNVNTPDDLAVAETLVSKLSG